MPRLVLAFLIFLLCSACGDMPQPLASSSVEVEREKTASLVHHDALGREVVLSLHPERVVALFGSFAEIWELAGGTLAGITRDALEEDRVPNSSDALLLGTNKEPNLELLLMLEPDLVICSADIAEQRDLGEHLESAAITHVYFHVEEFEDYLAALQLCTQLTERDDLYRIHGLAIQDEVTLLRSKVSAQSQTPPLVLLIRAMSTGARGRADELMAGLMLSELGAEHLTDRYPSLLSELSMEVILSDDPLFIFVITMGDSEKALQTIHQQMQSNPAWHTLKAVREENCYVLPKELFHFKPNHRWGEAYCWLAEALYPGLFPQLRDAVEISRLR
ncbi:MAG: ABC transporter substrate-binding protein [Symbiobacteriaceae bacterium]|nr:ABC transporter substrate-binding protein [Symbiobacteriaceae bacterium]